MVYIRFFKIQIIGDRGFYPGFFIDCGQLLKRVFTLDFGGVMRYVCGSSKTYQLWIMFALMRGFFSLMAGEGIRLNMPTV